MIMGTCHYSRDMQRARWAARCLAPLLLALAALSCAYNGKSQQAREFLEEQHATTLAPAMAYAVASGTELLDAAATGQRAIDDPAPVSARDAFHLGSVVKPMTATIAAILVDSGLIDWKTRLVDVYPGSAGSPYATVTLEQLLAHRAALPALVDDPVFGNIPSFGGGMRERRRDFVDWIVNQPPAGPRGEVHYSNAGYVVAAAMLEARSGDSWEKMLAEFILQPLDMASAGHGQPPVVPGHEPCGSTLCEIGRGEIRVPRVMAPAGDLHATLPDVVRFGQAWLRALETHDTILPAAELRYALEHDLAWGRQQVHGQPMLFHVGSAGGFVFVLSLFPQSDRVIAVAASAGTRGAEQSIISLLADLADIFAPPR